MRRFGRDIEVELLLQELERLKASDLSKTVSQRMSYFSRKMSNQELFCELCFCILAANYTSEGSWRIQNSIGTGFLTLSEKGLARKLKSLGYRFPNVRSKYIVRARKLENETPAALGSGMGREDLREWFVRNVHGLGYKEASHFLRNVGRSDYAIVDFHILDILSRHGLFEKPKTLTPKRYLQAERILQDICDAAGMTQGELDLYLWYSETGKILK